MYSGGENSRDSTSGRNQFNNWQFATQNACNNMPANNVDWAIIAQQWIKMREHPDQPGGGFVGGGMPEAPPPPMISSKSYHPKVLKNYDEQGEADMEVVKDDDIEPNLLNAQSSSSGQHQQLGSSAPQSQIKPFPEIWNIQPQGMQNIIPQQNQNQQWDWPARVALPPPALHVPTVETISTFKESTQLPLLKTPHMPDTMSASDKNDTASLDAAKRKMLPAWIREGLEKMEKEKQKQLERTQPMENVTQIISSNNDIKTMVKSSIIEMDSDKSGSEDEETDILPNLSKPSSPEKTIPEEDLGKSREELVKDLMLVVRRTLTEVLLEVTNDEIANIAQETFKKHKSKASSAQVFRKSALSTITGKLGLGAYADSSSETSSEEDEDENTSDHAEDSEEEIKSSMRSRRRAFIAIESEIEELLAEDASRAEHRRRIEREKDRERENEIVASQKSSNTLEREIGETQPDKKYFSNGGKRTKERTSRFSDNKDNKYKSGSSYFVPPNPVTVSNMTIPTTQASNVAPSHVPSTTGTTQSSDYDKSKPKSSSRRRRSYSSDSSDGSYDRTSNSSSKYKRASKSRSSYKRSGDSRSHRRRHSSDSDDGYRKKSSSKHQSSSSHSRRHRDRSASKSRSRSRSRSRSSYSSSKRSERY